MVHLCEKILRREASENDLLNLPKGLPLKRYIFIFDNCISVAIKLSSWHMTNPAIA
jgi:hypothetical protein